MTAPRESLVARAREWIAHADDDLTVATLTLTLMEQCPFRLVAYHAQQCAEKYLKAVLVLHGVDFPRTHNIARLLALCANHFDWRKELRDAEELTPFAIASRYPGDEEPVSESEARRALDLAQNVRASVRQALIGEGITLA